MINCLPNILIIYIELSISFDLDGKKKRLPDKKKSVNIPYLDFAKA